MTAGSYLRKHALASGAILAVVAALNGLASHVNLATAALAMVLAVMMIAIRWRRTLHEGTQKLQPAPHRAVGER